jgi:excisionase family DNA binding protein
MATRAKHAAPDIGVTSQLGLFDVVDTEPVQPSGRVREKAHVNADRAVPTSSAKLRALRRARDGHQALPRLCVKPEEAAQMLGVSRDYFDEHVKSELRIVRRGSRTILIPVAELVRWVEGNAARWA